MPISVRGVWGVCVEIVWEGVSVRVGAGVCDRARETRR